MGESYTVLNLIQIHPSTTSHFRLLHTPPVPTSGGVPVYFLGGGMGALTLVDSQPSPSTRPSPVVAHEGTTYQTLSLSLESWRASVTSLGLRAGGEECTR